MPPRPPTTPLTRSPRGRRARWSRPLLGSVKTSALLLEAALALSTSYLLALLLAARAATASAAQPSMRAHGSLRFAVLIPAHNEEDGISVTLASLAACCYPRDGVHVIVIADNCSDLTATRARAAGADVWERHDRDNRGKGAALIWALQRLHARRDHDAIVFVDADCVVSENLLNVIEAHIHAGAAAVQVKYLVANPKASTASALRYAAFTLMNTVRPLGKQWLGLSCGLFGTGMAFTQELLARVPWTATGLTEDGEYHMRLVDAGERVVFAPEASVRSAMPVSLGRSGDQQARWEQGKVDLIRRWSPRLVCCGLRQRNIALVHAGLEPIVPPQSLSAAVSAAGAVASVPLRSRRLRWLAAATLLGQAAFVLGSLRLVRAPRPVYMALLAAPTLMLQKLTIYARLIAGRGPKSWVRTARS